MKIIQIVLCLVLASLLVACTAKITFVDLPQDIKIYRGTDSENIPGEGMNIKQSITMSDSTLPTDTLQDADGKVPLSIGVGASTPAANVEGDIEQRDIEGTNERPVTTTTTTTSTDNRQTAQPAPAPAPAATPTEPVDNPTETPTTPTNPLVTSNKEVHELRTVSNRCFSWLEHNGNYYTGNVTFTFSDGNTFTISDASKSQDQNGGSNMQLMWYFSGNDYKPGDAEYNPSYYESGKGRASVFSAFSSVAGCPDTVTVTW